MSRVKVQRTKQALRYRYVMQDGNSKTDDYNDSGTFSLQEAARVCLGAPGRVISPDASGDWIVLSIRGL